MSGITDPNELYFRSGGWSFDGSIWRPNNLSWGYRDRWAEMTVGVASGTGNAVAVTGAVPAGYVYVLQAVSFSHDAAGAMVCDLDAVLGAAFVVLVHDAAWAANTARTWQGGIVLKAADYVRLTVIAPGDGKAAYLRVAGYTMKVG